MSDGVLGDKGMSREDVLGAMAALRGGDANWKAGKTWSLVYYAGDDVSRLVADAYTMFMAENGLSPLAFPSLRRFEAEVCAVAGNLFHHPEVAGTMTSGGSESVLMAVKTARDYAQKERGIAHPEMILPASVHPAFNKAAHYFGMKEVIVPVGADLRADVAAMERAITPNTILLVGSTPGYPHGVIDPIEDIAALAQSRGLLCHVDACLGGFLLPFAKQLGYAIPKFDFEVPGVTSLSADIHKYGYAAKGASLVLYRTKELRKHQFFAYTEWSGGVYTSPSMTGTRPGGAIAAAWAVLKYLGTEGYLAKAKSVMDTAQKLKAGIAAVPGLQLMSNPEVSIMAFKSDEVDVYALGDAIEARGWKLDRQQKPPTLHLMVTPAHAAGADTFLSDLRECTAGLKRGESAPDGSAAMYGMMSSMPDRKELNGFILDFMEGLYAL